MTEKETGKRFLKKCQEFLNISGFARYDDALDEIEDRLKENPGLVYEPEINQELRRLSEILSAEHRMIADAIRDGRLPIEYVEELIMGGAAFSRIYPESLEAIRETVERGRLSPEATASFRLQERKYRGRMLYLLTESYNNLASS